MRKSSKHVTNRRLRTPRAAAIAGILFAILYSTSYVMVMHEAPGDTGDVAGWLAREGENLRTGVNLLPFAGIAFLWFMGVVRDSIGHREDQFFSTLFFGSGFLYLAMVFLYGVLASGALNLYLLRPDTAGQSELFDLARATSHEALTIYSMRMAGMFTFVLGTIWTRTGMMPGWLIAGTFLSALLLLFCVSLNRWMVMVFPGWVLTVSVIELVRNVRGPALSTADVPGDP
jgi:uncharacterized membrane protein